MPITLAKIATNTASVTIKVGEDSVTVVYFPSRVTEKTFAQLQEFSQLSEATINTGFASLNSVLAHLIKSWDVYEDDAQTQMFPLDPERLAELPIQFRTQVLGAIMSDIRPEAVATQQTLS